MKRQQRRRVSFVCGWRIALFSTAHLLSLILLMAGAAPQAKAQIVPPPPVPVITPAPPLPVPPPPGPPTPPTPATPPPGDLLAKPGYAYRDLEGNVRCDYFGARLGLFRPTPIKYSITDKVSEGGLSTFTCSCLLETGPSCISSARAVLVDTVNTCDGLNSELRYSDDGTPGNCVGADMIQSPVVQPPAMISSLPIELTAPAGSEDSLCAGTCSGLDLNIEEQVAGAVYCKTSYSVRHEGAYCYEPAPDATYEPAPAATDGM